ncbi:unnamed protein product, partial [Brugia timori]|uniref:MABP domain-containing protein n=1 Tax=Brugia timori TaxID=42155 RepID=A0A0R3QR79_9BILA
MNEVLMIRSSDMGDENNVNPITSIIIVADKNRCPRGFSPNFILCFYISTHVVTDLCVVKDSDPIPMGFIAIDYTADS